MKRTRQSSSALIDTSCIVYTCAVCCQLARRMVNGYMRLFPALSSYTCGLLKSSYDLNVTSAQKSDKHLIPCAGFYLALYGARNKQLKSIII